MLECECGQLVTNSEYVNISTYYCFTLEACTEWLATLKMYGFISKQLLIQGTVDCITLVKLSSSSGIMSEAIILFFFFIWLLLLHPIMNGIVSEFHHNHHCQHFRNRKKIVSVNVSVCVCACVCFQHNFLSYELLPLWQPLINFNNMRTYLIRLNL